MVGCSIYYVLGDQLLMVCSASKTRLRLLHLNLDLF